MGRLKEDRTRVFYARVKPDNHAFMMGLAKRDKMNLSLWLDRLIDSIRAERAKASKK